MLGLYHLTNKTFPPFPPSQWRQVDALSLPQSSQFVWPNLGQIPTQKKRKRSSAFQDHMNFRCVASSKHSKPERRQQSLKSLRPVSRSVWYEKKKNSCCAYRSSHTHISTASRAMNLLQPFPCIHGAWSSKPLTWAFRQTWMKKTGGVERCLDLLDLWPYNDGVVFAYLLLPVLLVVEGTVVLVRVPMKTAVQPSTPTLETCNRHTPCSQRTVAPVGVHN